LISVFRDHRNRVLSIFIIIGILWVLLRESSLAINKFGVLNFLTSTEWNPVKEAFGAATSIYGTFITTMLALLFAVPSAIGIAIFVTEIAPNFLKGPIGVAIELGRDSSIIYGMWGLFLARSWVNMSSLLLKPRWKCPQWNLFRGTPLGIDI
jgi:phosphate transport system permease protein